jgi:hypothetical protein
MTSTPTSAWQAPAEHCNAQIANECHRQQTHNFDLNRNLTCDHIWHVILVPRRVENGVPLGRRIKMSAPHFDCFALGTFFLISIHDERQKP